MLKSLFYYNVVCFVLSIFPLVIFGHREKRSHWVLSLFYMVLVAYASRFILQALEITSPSQTLILAELLIGAGIIAMNEDWNPMGHAAFWSLLTAAGSFLLFASYITFFSHLDAWSLGLSVILLLLQVASVSLMVAHTYEILDVICRIRWRHVVNPGRGVDYFPKVSLHVPAYNEPPDMVKATLSALARLDYPNFEVIMIDDNTRDESLWRPVEEHCKKLGFKFFHLKDWPGYKSGALNFALRETDPDAEIVGVVDSDYIVEPNYLRDLVGLFQNPEVAFVQTPQDYRDFEETDSYAKACCDAYRYFFRISMATRNEHNGIIFAGTMGLVRKKVLGEVGGWDEWCITEDAELSLRILNKGYRGLYVDHTFGRGLMPLNYEGLKKQRFRWAFGGMQILRMHWKKLLPRWIVGGPESRLTFSQKFAYLSGGLQWLNDPLSVIFTVILLIGAGALTFGGSLVIQPMVGSVIIFPMAFMLFSLLRFIWALRIRLRSSWREAYGALTVLLGLTWVVTVACAEGLTRRQGVFLRTPKKKDETQLISGLRTVRWELGLSALCVIGIGSLLVGDLPKLPQLLLVALLAWQLFIYSSSPRSWLWSYRSGKDRELQPELISFHTAGHMTGKFVGESRTALQIVGGVLFSILLLWVAARSLPEMGRIFSIIPDYSYIPQPYITKIVKTPPAMEIKAKIYEEGDIALRGDIDEAASLWSPQGFIYDVNLTPDDPSDDYIWRGKEGIRQRYQEEFAQRIYESLAHKAISVVVEGDTARAENDLYAVIKTERGTENVLLRKSDKWTFKKEGSEWKITGLIVNSISRKFANIRLTSQIKGG